MGSRQIAQQETEVNDLYSCGQLTHRPLQFAFHSHAARTRPAPALWCGAAFRAYQYPQKGNAGKDKEHSGMLTGPGSSFSEGFRSGDCSGTTCGCSDFGRDSSRPIRPREVIAFAEVGDPAFPALLQDR